MSLSKNFQPVIKWSGSKRPIAQNIVSLFPRKFNNYYEPFCGGASVLRCLLNNIEEGKIEVDGKIICSDINTDLIHLWKSILNSPAILYKMYEELWNDMNSRHDEAYKREYYEFIRDRLNKEHKPWDFLFINRTCFNGLIRYNSKGEFNTSFHLNRKGIDPKKFEKIIFEWSELLRKYNVVFVCQSFDNIRTDDDDLVFCDPPYANTNGGMYDGNFNNQRLFEWLKTLNCKWLMTYDGKSGDIDNTYNIPEDLYKEHLYIESGNSSFKRIINKSNDSIVKESLYKNY